VLSLTNLLCGHAAGNEKLRYGHTAHQGAPRPVVVWGVTKACNLRCVHCYASADANPAPNELTDAEGFALLDDLKSFDVPAVLFSGGEPLVRPNIIGFIKHACALGLSATLSTNGLLIDDAMADRLANAGLKYIGISIDGSASRHDKLRGQAGAFQGSVAAIDRCRQRGIKVGMRFTVHALNREDLPEIFDLCLAHDVQRLCVYHLAYAGRGGKMQKVDLTAAQTRQVVDYLAQRSRIEHKLGSLLEVLTVGNHADAAYVLLMLERDDPGQADAAARLRGSGGNRSGCNVASIDPIGNVHYDQFSWHYSCGNVRETPFSRLWTEARDPRLTVLRDRASHLPPKCRNCRFLDVCNGNLRTRAEAATGDWLGDDPSCYLTDSEIVARETP
jgi:radical SAM protein with 4Fe4S-binding SPASM domain